MIIEIPINKVSTCTHPCAKLATQQLGLKDWVDPEFVSILINTDAEPYQFQTDFSIKLNSGKFVLHRYTRYAGSTKIMKSQSWVEKSLCTRL